MTWMTETLHTTGLKHTEITETFPTGASSVHCYTLSVHLCVVALHSCWKSLFLLFMHLILTEQTRLTLHTVFSMQNML